MALALLGSLDCGWVPLKEFGKYHIPFNKIDPRQEPISEVEKTLNAPIDLFRAFDAKAITRSTLGARNRQASSTRSSSDWTAGRSRPR